jgi:hypothetical protein
MTRRRSGRSGREHLAAIDGSRSGVARKGLLLEFTVDHPDVAQIDAIRKENAHRDRAPLAFRRPRQQQRLAPWLLTSDQAGAARSEGGSGRSSAP